MTRTVAALGKFIIAMGGVGAFCAAAFPASAQEPASAVGVQQSDARTIYDENYFAPFNAITAEDILKRIPGIQDVLTDAASVSTQRGFGSGGSQVLFNGQRLSGKTITVGSALQRIQANQVLRVEVIRGSVAGLDVRNEGTIVNVVLRETLVAGSGSWETRLSDFTFVGVKPGGKLSYAGTRGALGYVAGLEVTPRVDGRDRSKLFYIPGNPPGNLPFTPPVQAQEEDMLTETSEIVGNGSLSYAFNNGDIVNLNGRYSNEGQDEVLPSNLFDMTPAGVRTLVVHTDNNRTLDERNWEIGGDYEHGFAGGDTLRVLGIYTNIKTEDERYFYTRSALGIDNLTRIQLQFPTRTEKILRGTYQTKFSPAHSLEVGGEMALNALDSRIQAFTVANGAQTELRLFNPDAVIKETRFEGFATHTWRPRPGLSVEAAVETEYSKLTQRGRDANASRNLFFVKPRLDVRYQITPRNQLRARLQRTVSQLNFADFVSGFNVDPTRVEVLRAGNPNLVPEKQWLLEGFYEHRFANDQGVATLRAYYADVSDRIELTPVGTTILGATGNIGDAHYYGAELRAGIRLGWLGLPNASVDGSGYLQTSRAVDPFSGDRRHFAMLMRKYWTLSFRHDTGWRGFSYGFTLIDRGPTWTWDPNAVYDYDQRLSASAFAEMRVFGNTVLRLDVSKVTLPSARGERVVYTGHRGFFPAGRFELSKSNFPREIGLSLRGVF